MVKINFSSILKNLTISPNFLHDFKDFSRIFYFFFQISTLKNFQIFFTIDHHFLQIVNWVWISWFFEMWWCFYFFIFPWYDFLWVRYIDIFIPQNFIHLKHFKIYKNFLKTFHVFHQMFIIQKLLKYVRNFWV